MAQGLNRNGAERALRQTLWEGPLKLPSHLQMELRNDLAAFLIWSDRDRDGMVSADEFIEYVATAIKVSKQDLRVLRLEAFSDSIPLSLFPS